MNNAAARASVRSAPLISLVALAAAMMSLTACTAMQPKVGSETEPGPPVASSTAEPASASATSTGAPAAASDAAAAHQGVATRGGGRAVSGPGAALARKPSAPAPEIASGPGNSFVFDPRKLRWYAYDRKGKLVRSGRASGGKSYCPDIKRSCRTPAGRYSVYRKGGAGCRSTKFPIPRGGAPMPYCMFFRGGYAIHGGQVPGHNASHGCIRVPRGDAQWLHRNFVEHGTTVIVRRY